jgi:phage terminase large subunit
MRVELPNGWQPRAYQAPLWRYLHSGGKRAIAVWPRRHGKDDVGLHYTACAAHERVGAYWHLLPQQNQARKAIWSAVNPHTSLRRIDDAFPEQIREVTRDDEMFIRFRNGSTWQVIGSDNYDALVGTSPVGVVFSEWALSSPQAWSLIRPILLENDGWALFITTPRGRNHAYRMFEMARDSDDWFAERLTSEDTDVFSSDALDREFDELVAERGDEDGEAIFEQEYMTSWSAALPGAYYARTIDKMEREGQLCRVKWNPGKQVHTAWDLGASDQTVVWFIQWAGTGWAVIDYLAGSSKGPDFYAKALLDKPYVYGEHLLPHDAAHKEKALPLAATIAQTYRELGLRNVRVVPRTANVANDINEVRKILPICWFDSEKCKDGIDALRAYRREWDEKNRCFRDHPLHDWASDPADAFRTFAIGRPHEIEEANDNDHERARADETRSMIGGY